MTPCSHGLPPTRFGNSSEKVVHQIWAPGNANVPGGLLDLHDTWCHLQGSVWLTDALSAPTPCTSLTAT